MALKLNGSTGYLEYPNKLVGSFPMSMLVWVAHDVTNVQNFLITQSQSNADRYASAFLLNDFGNTKLATHRNPSNSISASKNTAPHPDATMKLAVAVFESTTSRRIYFGSNTPGTDTATSVDDIVNHDRCVVGAKHDNSAAPSDFLNGSVAESHWFNIALSDAQVASLLADTVKPEAISGWVDGWTFTDYNAGGTYTSIGGSRTMTAVGGVTASALPHPITRTAVPDATATGATLTGTSSLTAGSATATSAGTASGATLTATSSLTAGTATAAANGTLTTKPLKNNTRTVLASETSVTLNIYNATTGVLVVQKTSVTTNASGIATVSDPLIVAGTTYAYEPVMTGGRRRLPLALAA